MQYSRSALLCRWYLYLFSLLLWRTVYFRLFPIARTKSPTLVIGSNETCQTAKGLLALPVSPYEFKGLVSDELTVPPQADGASELLGTTRELTEIITKLGIKVVVLAIPKSPNRINAQDSRSSSARRWGNGYASALSTTCRQASHTIHWGSVAVIFGRI